MRVGIRKKKDEERTERVDEKTFVDQMRVVPVGVLRGENQKTSNSPLYKLRNIDTQLLGTYGFGKFL